MPGLPSRGLAGASSAFSGLPERPGRGAREINQAGPAPPCGSLTKPPEEGTPVQSEGGKEKGTQDGQGHCSPADKRGEHSAAKVPSFRSGRGRFFFFLISRQREPVICHAASNCVEGAQKEARRRGGRAGVGRVMDNGQACRWTGAPPPLDNPHWSGSVNNGAARTIFRSAYGGERACG